MISKKQAEEAMERSEQEFWDNIPELSPHEVQSFDDRLSGGEWEFCFGDKQRAYSMKKTYEKEELGWKVDIEESTRPGGAYHSTERCWNVTFS